MEASGCRTVRGLLVYIMKSAMRKGLIMKRVPHRRDLD
jgi:hypothetical protein